jgi:F0F1-type ATP synthase membrane subunit b/b'
MEVATIVELITTVGFPIVCVIAMGWFIYKIYQKSIDRENELREEIKENQKINGKFAEIINRYSLELGEIKTDVKEIKQDIIIITEKIG